MKAAYFCKNRTFMTKDVAVPKPGKEEVLIKVAACGVCGTDVHIYQGQDGSTQVTPPVVLGHEFSGIVAETGENVSSVEVGEHVTVDPNLYCGTCHFCQIGKKNLCQNLRAIGVNQDGGFEEYCVVPESQCYHLEEEVPLEYGAMTEPLACCIRGIDRVGIRTGDTVCIVGGGTIGLLMMQLAKLAGASRLVLSEPVAMRRAIGEKLGADAAIDPTSGGLPEQLEKKIGRRGADVVIECVGSLKAVENAFELADQGGRILLFGVPQSDADYPLHLENVFKKEWSIFGSFINPDTHGRAVEMINGGKIQLEPLITHRFPVEEVEAAIHMQQTDESIKVMVEL